MKVARSLSCPYLWVGRGRGARPSEIRALRPMGSEGAKPEGVVLWLSPARGRGRQSWLNWGLGELPPDWLDLRVNPVYGARLRRGARALAGGSALRPEPDPGRILVLTSSGAVRAFTARYGTSRGINWAEVASDWAGLELKPYISRLRGTFAWYDAWDVASLALWRAAPLERFSQLR